MANENQSVIMACSATYGGRGCGRWRWRGAAASLAGLAALYRAGVVIWRSNFGEGVAAGAKRSVKKRADVSIKQPKSQMA